MASLDAIMRAALVKDFTWALLKRQKEKHDPQDPWAGIEKRRAAEDLMKDAVMSGTCVNLDTFRRAEQWQK